MQSFFKPECPVKTKCLNLSEALDIMYERVKKNPILVAKLEGIMSVLAMSSHGIADIDEGLNCFDTDGKLIDLSGAPKAEVKQQEVSAPGSGLGN